MPRDDPHDEGIIANVEIDPPSGENVEWHWVGGVPLSPLQYRLLAKAADFSSFSQHITQIAPDERERG